MNIVKNIADAVVRRVSQALPPLNNAVVEKTFPAREPYQPTPPVNVDMFPEKLTQSFLQPVTFHAHSIYRLKDVYVTWNGGVMRNFRLFLPSLVHDYYAETFQDTLLLRQWVGEKVNVATDCVAICHNQWSVENYYHWMADTLPRLLVLRELHPNMMLELPQPIPPKELPSYIKATASALGFNRYAPVNPQQIMRAACVVVPELTATPIKQNPELIRQVRAELLSAYGPAPAPATRRIFAARSASGARRIINEPEVDAVLEEFGFEKVYFERITFSEQIQLMHETTILLGVHGAGMTNMFFLQPGAKVLELLDKDYQVHCYYWLASCFNLPYYLIPCQGTNPEHTSHSDIQVDIVLLRKVIEMAVA
ncbi:glycosyltransferase family 61 protein [Hymenobacter antarcticus]|uniref:Glycosyltransferase 61 catalytic domain-containing protein n=1 Tax=Hymenobacter antarcticus TaxID=486270 RepID=A0ABP7R6D6_9BACT